MSSEESDDLLWEVVTKISCIAFNISDMNLRPLGHRDQYRRINSMLYSHSYPKFEFYNGSTSDKKYNLDAEYLCNTTSSLIWLNVFFLMHPNLWRLNSTNLSRNLTELTHKVERCNCQIDTVVLKFMTFIVWNIRLAIWTLLSLWLRWLLRWFIVTMYDYLILIFLLRNVL